jgi:hypothetical protein
MSEQNKQEYPALEKRIEAIQQAAMDAINKESELYEASTGLDRDPLIAGRALLDLAHGLLRFPLEATLEEAEKEGDTETIEIAKDALGKAEVIRASVVKSNRMAMGITGISNASVALGLVEAGLEFLSDLDESLDKIASGEEFGTTPEEAEAPVEDASDILRNFNSIIGGKDGSSDTGK